MCAINRGVPCRLIISRGLLAAVELLSVFVNVSAKVGFAGFVSVKCDASGSLHGCDGCDDDEWRHARDYDYEHEVGARETFCTGGQDARGPREPARAEVVL